MRASMSVFACVRACMCVCAHVCACACARPSYSVAIRFNSYGQCTTCCFFFIIVFGKYL